MRRRPVGVAFGTNQLFPMNDGPSQPPTEPPDDFFGDIGFNPTRPNGTDELIGELTGHPPHPAEPEEP